MGATGEADSTARSTAGLKESRSLSTRLWRQEVIVLLSILVVAGVLRVWDYPAGQAIRDVDEPGYLAGGLLLWEGITPGYSAAPGAPVVWLGWLAAAARSALYLVAPSADAPHLPLLVRPFSAVERALFEFYRNLVPLRHLVLSMELLLGLCAVWSAFRIGRRWAGIAGAVLAGGLVAFLPLVLDVNATARPYGFAWSFGIIALDRLCATTEKPRHFGAAVLLGLAIASRIEMVVFAPVLVWELWRVSGARRAWKDGSVLLAQAGVVALVLSPWFVTNLVGNLRVMLDVGFLNPGRTHSPAAVMTGLLWSQGLGFTVLIAISGLVPLLQRDGRLYGSLAAYTGFLMLAMLHGSSDRLRYDAAGVLVLCFVAVLALAPFERRVRRLALVSAAVAVALPLGQAVRMIVATRRAYVPDQATHWIESRVEPGTLVYLRPTFADPLPTPEAADRLWHEVAGQTAADLKFRRGLARFRLPFSYAPRALSDADMVQERGMRRRWFLLGAETQLPAPRFDIHLIESAGMAFGLKPGDAVQAFKDTGGVLVWRGRALSDVGRPDVSWVGEGGEGTFIYCTPSCGSR